MDTLNIKEQLCSILSTISAPVHGALLGDICREIINAVDDFKPGEEGFRTFMQWVLDMPLPSKYGLADGSAFDHIVRQILDSSQKVLTNHSLPPFELPSDAPRLMEIGQSQGRGFVVMTESGGSNRAQAKYWADREAKQKAKEEMNNTTACKTALGKHHKGVPVLCKPKNWKRIKIKRGDGITVRIFQCGDVFNTVVFDIDKDQLEIRDGNEMPDANPDTIKELKAAAKTIKHCGDYGSLHYNPAKGEVVWCAGDADGEVENGHTDFDDIERMFAGIDGVEKVTIECEWAPDVDEGFINLGSFGIEV